MADSFVISPNLLKFEDVRQQIIEFLKSNSEYSATFDWSASNISYIIDSMSYVSMLMSYQISNVANNNFIESTNYRKNAVSKAKEIGYRPKRKTSAMAIGTLTYVDSTATFTEESTITINSGSSFVSNKGSIYTNTSPIVLTYFDENTLTSEYELYEGEIKTYQYSGTAGNTPFQSFVIPSQSVEESSLKMSVVKNITGSIPEEWVEAKSIFNITTDKIFFVEEDVVNEYYPKIIFGDNIIGKIIESDEIATVTYIETKGSLANNEYLTSLPASGFVPSVDITSFSSSNFLPFDSNSITFGGTDNESMEDIKAKAPKYYASAGRAVTKEDFKTILNSYPYIMSSSVIGGNELYPELDCELGNIYLSGVPVSLSKINFLTTNEKIYLSTIEENNIKNELDTYNVISTKLNFFKPSYVYVDLTPSIELSRTITLAKEEELKLATKANLVSYTLANFFDYSSFFRSSKLTAVMDSYSDVISSKIDGSYYFIVNSDSFYASSTGNENSINLPVSQSGFNSDGTPIYTNFVKTNIELATDLSIDVEDIPFTSRTISGIVTNSNVSRLLYNEDIPPVVEGDPVLLSDVYLSGITNFFEFYRFENNSGTPIVRNVKNINDVELVVTPSVSAALDSFVVSYDGSDLGTLYRTNNPYFSGIVGTENDFPVFDTISDGQSKFVEVIANFSVSGDDKDFTSVKTGDFIIYNASGSGVWQKANFKGNISAITNESLYTTNTPNDILNVIDSGTGGGILVEAAGSGDNIIFNINSTTNPNNKWELMDYRAITFDDSYPIVKEAVDYDIKLIISEDLLGTNFLGRSDAIFYDHDLIFYNPAASSDESSWVKLINVSSSAEMLSVPASATISGNSTSLFEYDYDEITGIQIGEFRLINEYGNFMLYDKILWLSNTNRNAAVNDILVYVGNGYWRIFQSILSYLYELDGSVISALPLRLNYGDYFDILGTPGIATNFNGTVTEEYSNGDQIVYLGDNTWKRLSPIASISVVDSSEFPKVAELGDILKITEDGYFGNTGDITDNPYIDYVSGVPYIDGDYIIFTISSSGSKWKQLKEYSMLFNPAGAKDTLNELGFNSSFNYTFNYSTKYYEVYFNDIFNNVKLGQFTYNIEAGTLATNADVGKLKFETFVVGNYNSVDQTLITEVKSLFADSNVLDTIQFIPRNKIDSSGTVIVEKEEDFDTQFNQYLIVNVNNTQKI